MNKIILIGRLTRDPEVRSTSTGKTVASFSLAVNRRFASKDSAVLADFFNVSAFDKTGDFVRDYTSKGQQVAVVGRLQNREWEDSEGNRKKATEVIAEEVYFADSKISKKNEEPELDFTNVDLSDVDSLPF